VTERVIVREEPVVVEEAVLDDEVTYICARCGMEIAGEPIWRAGEVYCCLGCALGTGCTCVKP
jgi:hypothetical protein